MLNHHHYLIFSVLKYQRFNMLKSIVLFLCVVSLILQVYADSSSEEHDSSQKSSHSSESEEADSNNDIVKIAFKALMSAIDKALAQAQTKLDKASEQVHFEATMMEEKAQKDITEMVIVPLKRQLDDFVEEAKKKGVDITNCQTYVDQFEAIPNKTIRGVIGCITSQVDRAKIYCDDALANCRKIQTNMAKSQNQIFKKCRDGNLLSKTVCYAQVMKKIAYNTSNAPQRILQDVMKGTALLAQIIPILRQCESNEISGAGSYGAELIAKYSQCVESPNANH